MVNLVSVVERLIRSGRYPALVFLFSRKMVEERAVAISRSLDLLEDGARQKVREYISEKLPPQARLLHPALAGCLERGVGFHHAGLLPSAKRAVEDLFVSGYLPIVVCTETFALGVNYPARAVAIGQVTKRDDEGYRPLTSREYLQMGGRAGRRGQDRVGYVYICVDPDYPEEAPVAAPSQPEEVNPAGEYTCESVLRLVDALGSSPELLREYVEKSYAAYRIRLAREEIAEELSRAEVRLEAVRREVQCLEPETCPVSPLRRKEVNAIKGDMKSCSDTIRELERLLAKKKLSDAKRTQYKKSLARAEERRADLERQLAEILERAACLHVDREKVVCAHEEQLRVLEKEVDRLRRRRDDLAWVSGWGKFAALAAALAGCGFLAGQWELTPKGRLALDAGPGGAMLAEIVMRLVQDGRVGPLELVRHAGGCAYEGDTGYGTVGGVAAESYDLLAIRYDLPGCNYDPGMAAAVGLWAEGAPLAKAVGLVEVAPGDFVVCARRAAEALRGLAATRVSPEVREAARKAYELVWRDEVAEVF